MFTSVKELKFFHVINCSYQPIKYVILLNPLFLSLFSIGWHFFNLLNIAYTSHDCFNITQAYVDSVLDLASHFITRLRRYASFCRTLASHAVTAGTGNNRNVVASPTQSSATPATSQGKCAMIWNCIHFLSSFFYIKFYFIYRPFLKYCFSGSNTEA